MGQTRLATRAPKQNYGSMGRDPDVGEAS